MISITLQRFVSGPIETLGILVIPGHELFVCKTLELPWKNNENNISCIPSNSAYPCKYTRSNRLSEAAGHDVFTYEILNVPHRTGIRFHSCNFVHQLLGCVGLGAIYDDINHDGVPDIVNSKATVQKFEDLMERKDFTLRVVNA